MTRELTKAQRRVLEVLEFASTGGNLPAIRDREWFVEELRDAFDELTVSGHIKAVSEYHITELGRSALKGDAHE